jgi:uncharacterized protein (DUF488 family)
VVRPSARAERGGRGHGVSDPVLLFSIGHSNHPAEGFANLLKKHDVEVLVDVRSHPYSRYAPHFDTSGMKALLSKAGVKYLYLGRELGGRPEGAGYYDAEGRVLYARLVSSPLFLEGIDRLQKGAPSCRVAVMCAEEDPMNCHRRLLIGPVLRERGIVLNHIRGDGRVQTEDELLRTQPLPRPASEQSDLFHATQEDGSVWNLA